jgi:hypothetical protein
MREGHYTLKPLSKKKIRDKRYLHSNNHKPVSLLYLNDCCVGHLLFSALACWCLSYLL